MDGFDFYGNNPDNNDNNIDNMGKSNTEDSFTSAERSGREYAGQDDMSYGNSATFSDNAQYNADSSAKNDEPPVQSDNYQYYNNGNNSDYSSNTYYGNNNYDSNNDYNSGSNYNSSSYNSGYDYQDVRNSNSGGRDNDSTSGGYNTQFKTPHYYTENYKKRKKGIGLWQMVAVSLISSILGGVVVGSFLLFVAPSIPALSKYLPTQTVVSNNTGTTKIEYKIAEAASQVSAIAEKASPSIVGIRVTAVNQIGRAHV